MSIRLDFFWHSSLFWAKTCQLRCFHPPTCALVECNLACIGENLKWDLQSVSEPYSQYDVRVQFHYKKYVTIFAIMIAAYRKICHHDILLSQYLLSCYLVIIIFVIMILCYYIFVTLIAYMLRQHLSHNQKYFPADFFSTTVLPNRPGTLGRISMTMMKIMNVLWTTTCGQLFGTTITTSMMRMIRIIKKH